MKTGSSIGRMLRGRVTPQKVAREVMRRTGVAIRRWHERGMVRRWDAQSARLRGPFSGMEAATLVAHFQRRTEPRFLPGFSEPHIAPASLEPTLLPNETATLISAAELIVADSRWPLLGLGEIAFGSPPNWHRDPLSGYLWPLEYHADLNLLRNDGSDVRTLWELNRLSHLVTLARAYAVTNDERFSGEFFRHVASWHSHNPYGRGANWTSAMEVSLRAMNLLGAFEVFRRSDWLDETTLATLLALFDHHGRFIRQNLEFSYLATSNHYLSNVVGLLWLGVMLPELEKAEEWRDFGLRRVLQEMDRQVLADGADFEASTGYHRFVLELFLYSFILCRTNAIEIEERYWKTLHQMLEFVCAYLRPDGNAPLIGDSDGGQVLPISNRSADDHAYLLPLGAVVFNDPRLKLPKIPIPPELLWITGEQAVREYEGLMTATRPAGSHAFPDAGVYVLRDNDLYLLFNAGGAGITGRGSHGHNDALSIEVSACGRGFIVDPGTYVYTANLRQRHLFRSTAYHSTVQIDGAEQNTTEEQTPFVIGDEAQPRVLEWETGPELDIIEAEHYGYRRLLQPVTHRRRVVFNKRQRYWFVSDQITGAGEHELTFRFHFGSGLVASVRSDAFVEVCDKMKSAKLLIGASKQNEGSAGPPELEACFSSRDYGIKQPSLSACWSLRTELPFGLSFVIIPICAGEDEFERLRLARDTNRQSPIGNRQ